MGEGHDRAKTTSPQCQTEESFPQTENKTKKGHRSWLCSTQTVEQQNGEARQTEKQLHTQPSCPHLHGRRYMLRNDRDGVSPPKLPGMKQQPVRAAFIYVAGITDRKLMQSVSSNHTSMDSLKLKASLPHPLPYTHSSS